MDFPSQPPRQGGVDAEAVAAALGVEPVEVLAGPDYFAVLKDETDVRRLTPDMSLIAKLDCRGVIATARGDDYDFVSRFFAPKYGIPEDPVTGSAHCALAPYWAAKLGKSTLSARQISKRGGDVGCVLRGDRVALSGRAVLFMRAEIVV